MTDRQRKRLLEIQQHTPTALAVTRKAFSGKSKAAAIKAKCLDCCGWQRREITLCTAESCPLWPYRPFQGDSLKFAPQP